MNLETYEQIAMDSTKLGSEKDYLTENLEVDLLLYKGNPVGVGLPNFIEDEIEYCEPGSKGKYSHGCCQTSNTSMWSKG